MQRALQEALPQRDPGLRLRLHRARRGSSPRTTRARRPSSGPTGCGTPFPGIEVRIVDPETGEELPTGELGEIAARGFGMFEGYHNDPVRTAEAIDADGLFHTGDIGSVDEGGRIAYHGRHEGHAQGRWRERRRARGRVVPLAAPGRAAGAGRRHPRRAARRGAGRVRRGRARARGDRGGADRVLPRRRSRASRSPGTSASSRRGRCRRRRSRSSSYGRSCSPSSTSSRLDTDSNDL